MILPITDTNMDEPDDTCRSLTISIVLSWIPVILLISFPFRDDPELKYKINMYFKYQLSLVYNYFVIQRSLDSEVVGYFPIKVK